MPELGLPPLSHLHKHKLVSEALSLWLLFNISSPQTITVAKAKKKILLGNKHLSEPILKYSKAGQRTTSVPRKVRLKLLCRWRGAWEEDRGWPCTAALACGGTPAPVPQAPSREARWCRLLSREPKWAAMTESEKKLKINKMRSKSRSWGWEAEQ